MVSSASKFRVIPSSPAMADRLAEIQRLCFPTLAADHLITADHYRAQIAKFPEGQLAVIDENDMPVAMSSDLRTDIDFADPEHRYIDMVDHNWIGTHNPKGAWLYGMDISVHPDFQGAGLSRLLYQARQDLARRLNLRGHVAGGMIKGYPPYKDQMNAQSYINKVVAGEIFDPVLSVQLKRGFKVRGVINNYLDDPASDNKAALIVWENPDYTA